MWRDAFDASDALLDGDAVSTVSVPAVTCLLPEDKPGLTAAAVGLLQQTHINFIQLSTFFIT